MNYIKRLFGADKPNMMGPDRGLYYYIRCKRCGEIIRVRIDPMNDLSWNETVTELFVRKTIVGKRCYNRIEGEFHYDKDRRLLKSEIQGGEMADKAAYEAQTQAQTSEEST